MESSAPLGDTARPSEQNVKIALVYPPTCDPTAPYLAVPALTGFLRHNGVEALPVRAGEVPVAVRGSARGRRPPNAPNALG